MQPSTFSPHAWAALGDQRVVGTAFAAPAADVVCAVRLVGSTFVQLVEVDDLRSAAGKADVPQGGNGSAAVLGVLDDGDEELLAVLRDIQGGPRCRHRMARPLLRPLRRQR